MAEIIILDKAPVIFTKDKSWVAQRVKLEEGAVILLPDDAVLYELAPKKEVRDE